MKRILLSILLTLTVVPLLYGQQEQDEQHIKDSILSTNAASEAVELLVRERLLRIQDSITEQTLKLQIANTAEVGKRKALEAELAKKQSEDSLKLEKLKNQIQESKLNSKGYPVVVAGDTVRWIYTRLGSLTASERAQICVDKIVQAAAMFIPTIDSLTVRVDEANVEVVFRDKILTTITIADALWNDQSQMDMANEISTKVLDSMLKHMDLTSLLTIFKQIGLSLVVILMCYFSVRFINRMFRKKTSRFFLSKIGTWFKGWRIKDYQVMDAKRQVRTVLWTVRMFRLSVSVFLLYIVLPILFSIFPMTRRLADTLFGWVLEPVKSIFWAVVGYLPKLFVILVIWFVMRYVVRGAKYLMNEIAVGNLKINGFYSDWAPATYNIVRFLLYAFSFVMIFPFLPYSDSDIFKGVSVFIGVIFSLGSSSAISNMVAGMVITYMRPFKIGDHIKIGDMTGDVLEKTPFVTRIKTAKQEVVTIPNGSVLSASVINYSTASTDQGVIFHITITIGYDVPWRQIHQMMIQAAQRSQYVLSEPAPYVLQTSLDDFYVSYQLCAYTKNPEKQATIYSELNQNVQDVFNENDVEIMSPHYRAQRDGNTTTTPEKYRSTDYTPPVFTIYEKNSTKS